MSIESDSGIRSLISSNWMRTEGAFCTNWSLEVLFSLTSSSDNAPRMDELGDDNGLKYTLKLLVNELYFE